MRALTGQNIERNSAETLATLRNVEEKNCLTSTKVSFNEGEARFSLANHFCNMTTPTSSRMKEKNTVYCNTCIFTTRDEEDCDFFS